MNERVKEKNEWLHIFDKNDKMRDNKAIYIGY